MKNHYSISIPKPCHEDWNAMSQREKGKFCSSCSKTVIDFTKMNTPDIQEFIHQNKTNRICGHFKQTQLDSINLHIPSQVLEKHNSFHKVFLLALLITMGTSLMNCTNKNGDRQKIDSVEVIDTLNNNKTLDILGGIAEKREIDSFINNTCSTLKNIPKTHLIEKVDVDGELEIQTVGDIEIIDPPITGEYEFIEPIGIIVPEEVLEDEIVMGFVLVETPPEFKNTPAHLSNKEKRDYFSKEIAKIISKNFNTSVCLELKGKQKINVQFKIDKAGNVIETRARAPHIKLEMEAIRVMTFLPQFIPAKQAGRTITTVYALPIIFQTEE